MGVLGDAEVMRFSTHGVHSRDEIVEWLNGRMKAAATGPAQYAVLYRDSLEFLGFSGLLFYDDPDGDAQYEASYRFARKHWNQGIATEALKACLANAFENLELPAVLAVVEEANIGSIRVVEKSGLKFQKNTIYKNIPVRKYLITREDFLCNSDRGCPRMAAAMSTEKVVRTICLFAENTGDGLFERVDEIAGRLEERGFLIQTKRICFANALIRDLAPLDNRGYYLGVGSLPLEQLVDQFDDFIAAKSVSCGLDCTTSLGPAEVDVLVRFLREAPERAFLFAYTFNNVVSSPYFPSAHFAEPGFSVGLQPTDLAAGCSTLEEWFGKMANVWQEVLDCFGSDPDFLGIDSSVAPLFEGDSSLVSFIRRLHGSFARSVGSDTYMRITEFIKAANPRPIGLCGLMLPCLEDFELAAEYEKGEFSIERNLFLSLHCGLGIDTYPVGIDEDPESILSVLRLEQRLSTAYGKPLSARFVSDGAAKIGEKTDFKNQYLRDVVVRPLIPGADGRFPAT